MKVYIILFAVLLALPFLSADTCSSTNSVDIDDIPCVAFTQFVNCSDNVTIFNASNENINYSVQTYPYVLDIYNFTIDLPIGAYEIVDCSNNSLTFVIGNFKQGYGVNIFTIIFPSVILSFTTLFFSWRMFRRFGEDDDEQMEFHRRDDSLDSYTPRSRLMPIVIMLFAFIPMIFMVGTVQGHLDAYLPTANATGFYAQYYILFITIFFITCLISIIVWVSSFITKRNIKLGKFGNE